MKYQPPNMDELTAEQRELFNTLQAEEKQALLAQQADDASRQQAVLYHNVTRELLIERAHDESVLSFEGPITDEALEQAFNAFDIPPSEDKLQGRVAVLNKRKALRIAHARRLKTRKKRLSDAVHAGMAKSSK